MDIPDSISISKKVRDTFQTIKNRTGVPNNVLSRIAIMLAINSQASVQSVAKDDSAGQTLDRELMFGELLDFFDIALRQYRYETQTDLSMGELIASLIEIGAHKMGHCRSLTDLARLE
ncbi:DUF1832 domain-containing protein [Seongchinamella sediminis]|uniref:DUF1832 domain-containing protein n=1 Tax=Seongchinamella sediminis TaxID=2283635 RepID=A0A3L7DRH9_9GAMM|nr:DndE family protein [Seongchinamella sediminis]RLQ20257.1 DUF1832 domain-containing protein [Seongchinamella sediminis]